MSEFDLGYARLVFLVEEWTHDVAGAVAQEEDCISDDFLGVACDSD